MEKFAILTACFLCLYVVDVISRNLQDEVWDNIRLADGGIVYQGRVEVKVNGTWGTVCDDGWSTFDGVVACKQLGFDGLINIKPGGFYGPGTGPIWHDDLRCTSRESSLSECQGLHDPNKTDCSHAEDAGVICSPPQIQSAMPVCRDNQFLCVSQKKCIPARWVCDNQHDCEGDGEDEASLICYRSRNCGFQSVRPISRRIVGGHPARPGTWPWAVYIKVVFPPGIPSQHLCGGTLIATQWVLTAAHCFDRYNWVSFRVVVGDTDTNITEGSEQEIAIASVHKHKGYVAGAHSNDIALIKLQHPVDLSSPNVNLACLPIFGESSFTPADTCYVAGWGQTKGTGRSTVLRHAQVPILNNTQCAAWYGGNLTVPLDDRIICAGYQFGGKDACQGDSGGPLSCSQDGHTNWTVVGVVIWGDGCAQAQRPGIYTDVRYFMSWIAETIRDPGPPALVSSEIIG